MKILNKRIFYQWRFNLDILKGIIDWTTLLYLCVPVGLFGYYFYRETVLQQEFGFLSYIPFGLTLFLLLSITQAGVIRSFLESADQLFLIQYKQQWRSLTIGGLIYSLLWQFFFISGFIALMSPILLLLYKQTLVDLIAIGLCSFITYFAKQLIMRTSWPEWLQTAINLLFIALWTYLFTQLPISLLLTIGVITLALLVGLYSYKYVFSLRAFDKMLNVEIKQSMLLVSAVFMASRELRSMKAPKQSTRKPWFFKQRLCKNEVVELIVKTLIRDKRYKWAYLRLIGITLPLYLIFSYWGQILLAITTYFMITSYTNSVISEMREHTIMQIFHIPKERWISAQLAVKNIILVMAMLVVALYYIVMTILT